MSNYSVVACSLERHGSQILEIFNEAIVNSTALYDYKPRTMANMEAWFAAKSASSFPVVGLEDMEGSLLGFASFGPFRVQPAYKYSVEHSVYVRADQRGKGLGKVLLRLVIDAARVDDYHAVIGAIDADNKASIALHQAFGFKEVGRLPQVGFKFGRWLDLVFMQLTLETPSQPIDG